MLKSTIITIFVLTTTITFGSGRLIKDGKIYNMVEIEQNVCGEFSSPQYTAAVFTLSAARQMFIQSRKALCLNGSRKDCSMDDMNKAGQLGIFTTIRSYPSRFSSEGCKRLRTKCEDDCKALNLFDAKTCLIECNQYETYNK